MNHKEIFRARTKYDLDPIHISVFILLIKPNQSISIEANTQ
jgi:hypothetical protein